MVICLANFVKRTKTMSTAPSNDLWSQALALPEIDRLNLAQDLMASVKPSGLLSVNDPDFEDVLAQRQQQLREGTAATFSVEETIAAMRQAILEQGRQ
jgi:hypothetical protein